MEEKLKEFLQNIEVFGEARKESLTKLAELMKEKDFFTAPASTWFHGNYPGGLYDHSSHVFRRLLTMLSLDPNGYSGSNFFLVGMFHDLCKMDFYKPTKKSIKNKETGAWEEQDVYTIEENFPMGHGIKSLYLLMENGVELTRDEALAIRWHMGAYDVGSRGAQEVIDVWMKSSSPLVLFTHIADGFAAHIDENTGEVFFGKEKKQIPDELKIENYRAQSNWDRYKSMPTFPEGTSDKDKYICFFRHYLGEREGMERLLSFICGQRSDFFTAPATEYNQYAFEGGLCKLSLRMFDYMTQLVELLDWPVQMDTVAAISLLFGVGRINTFKMETRHRKNSQGEWEDYTYISKDEELPFGDTGSKATYIIQPYQQTFGKPLLSREEAMAIRWVEGALTGANIKECSQAFDMFPLAYIAHAAYLIASFTKEVEKREVQ